MNHPPTPLISCICLEYGRPAQVPEALECFLRQTGGVPAELIILNSCPQIQYAFDHPCVKVINLSERPSSLGKTRNIAIEAASGKWLAVWDSDDHFAPWHLKSFADRISEGLDWLWLDQNYYCEAGHIKKICQGAANTVAFTKAAWERVGKYGELTVGEDRDFVGRLTKTCVGARVSLRPDEIGYLINWANSVYHVSGLGMDKPGQTTAWERSRLDLEQRIRRGTVKTGKILLQPAIRVKPEVKIQRFLASREYLNSVHPGSALKASKVRMFHAVERHDGPRDLRKEQAWASWNALYDQGVIASHYRNYARDATSIGDPRKLPFLKDVLKFAMDQADDDSIVFLTNDDSVLHPALPDLLLRRVAEFGPCCSQRCEFRGNLPKLSDTPMRIASLSLPHVGRDLFAATKRWWLEHWDQIGDPILGASSWDLHLACVFRLHHGIISTRKNLEQCLHPADLPRGYILHRSHPARWLEKGNVSTAKSQWHNYAEFKNFAEKNLHSLKFNVGNTANPI